MEKEQEQPELKKFTSYQFKQELKGEWRNTKLDRSERATLGKDLFPGKSKITEKDMDNALGKLKRERISTSDLARKKEIKAQEKLIRRIKDK